MQLSIGYRANLGRTEGNEELRFFQMEFKEHECAAMAAVMKNNDNEDMRESDRIEDLSKRIEQAAIKDAKQNPGYDDKRSVIIEKLYYPEEFRKGLTIWKLQEKYKSKNDREKALGSLSDEELCVIISTCGTKQGQIALGKFLKDRSKYKG